MDQNNSQETEQYLLNNWEFLPKDLKLLILNDIDLASRFKFCQADKRISEFCRKYKLTADDHVLSQNPEGQLIDTRRKQADLINRGFRTVFSLILNENKRNNGEHGDSYGSTNIPNVETMEVIELVFGADLGTDFYSQHNHDVRDYRIHMNMFGLPPKEGDLIKFLFINQGSYSGEYFNAVHFTQNDDLETIIYEFSGTEPSIGIYSDLLEGDHINELLSGQRVIIDGNLAMIFELPCP